VREFARTHDWIRLVSIPGEADPTRGRSSVRAFNAGVMNESASADLVTGLDADVSFDPTYFASLRTEFERYSHLGIAAGLCYEDRGEGWHPVHVTYPNLRGAALTYRGECLAELLPLEARYAWDGIAIVRANTRGWLTLLVPGVSYFHHRPTGARDRHRFRSYAEEGDTSYYMWYRPSYMLLRTLYHTIGCRDVAAAGLAWGYARSVVGRRGRHREAGFAEIVRRNQAPAQWLLRAREVTGGIGPGST
jgi:GT2 family glycosyltransferase